ncbi:YhcN/YlaJ family sporulation lipoprotein [Bacillus marasmi]|uniref:YhcN/YlaJ family sporulation lipoprotein n=1 Tax=Bacillus marasmi TaxID=1926279 RepID=UPI0011C8D762|nr:YhcN/YlaJ family sporulation lipoprotein [Bacillus marasmi]
MKGLFPLIVIAIILVGCGAQNNAANDERQNLVKVKNSTIQDVDRETGQKVSKHLVDLATSVPNVRDATAVVIGNYAVVGIDVDQNIDRSQVGSIKYSVAESLKNDPHGAKAVVIADPDLTARLKEVAADVRAGNPISGIMNELSDISGRLMPEVPADMIEPRAKNGKNATENPKKEMDKQDSKQLEKEQDDQSKHHKD